MNAVRKNTRRLRDARSLILINIAYISYIAFMSFAQISLSFPGGTYELLGSPTTPAFAA